MNDQVSAPRPDVEQCPQCASRVFVDDLHCVQCGADLVFDTELGVYTLTADPCRWRAERQCNWAARSPDPDCPACHRTDVTELAAPRLDLVAIYCAAIRRTMRRLHDGFGVTLNGLAPDLRYHLDWSAPGHPVTIGHASGLVTLDVAEADPVHLESQRLALGEPYRTPLGHVRHETGHWVWSAGVEPNPMLLDEFRHLFGDEQADYQAALERHYGRGDDGSWQTAWVSRYAAAHPWEDFAESAAHVLHIDDVLNVATLARLVGAADAGFPARYAAWTELVIELNEVARAMGEPDVYPFAPPPAAVDKMRFVDQILHRLAPCEGPSSGDDTSACPLR